MSALFPGFTTVYLKSLGELLICANRLEHAREVSVTATDSWKVRADDLVSEALLVADTVASAGGGNSVRVTMTDGIAVVADLDYLEGLVRKLHRHHSLGLVQATLSDRQLVAS